MRLMEERSMDELVDLSGGGAAELAELLGSSSASGIMGEDLAERRERFGVNAFAQKRLKSYCELVWDGLHDMMLVGLLGMAALSFVFETVFGEHPETGWIESVAIVVSVAIIVNVTASTDFVKERTFRDLSAVLDSSNKKSIVRNGVHLEVEDAEIVVGDVLAFNSHNHASIPVDGLLLSGTDVKMDEVWSSPH